MKNYPLKYQVCTFEQAEWFADLLGDNAPGSYFVWLIARNPRLKPEICERRIISKIIELTPPSLRGKLIAAYTGDELGVLLPDKYSYISESGNVRHSPSFGLFKGDRGFAPSYYEESVFGIAVRAQNINRYEAHAKADLAIKGLKEGWIKPEAFQYVNPS